MSEVNATCGANDWAVRGFCTKSGGFGVLGLNQSSVGVRGSGHIGVMGWSPAVEGSGVYGLSQQFHGVYGRTQSNGYGVFGDTTLATATAVGGYNPRGKAGYFTGNVVVDGTIYNTLHTLKIDHPLDPTNKYLYHSSIQSADMKNLYDGVTSLDDKGEALIDLPNWFGALNKDFRYQLTAIGAPGPNLYIAEEISGADTNYSRFKIAGGTSGMKVCWQVTGVRKDPWANANRIEVEEEKSGKERGYYKHPEVYGQPAEKGISHLLFPRLKEEDDDSIKSIEEQLGGKK